MENRCSTNALASWLFLPSAMHQPRWFWIVRFTLPGKARARVEPSSRLVRWKVAIDEGLEMVMATLPCASARWISEKPKFNDPGGE
ncbi:Uncharacterised protein [Bordetella pertussis]|nr:Uncharacterised protein [Bordetella pertussis]